MFREYLILMSFCLLCCANSTEQRTTGMQDVTDQTHQESDISLNFKNSYNFKKPSQSFVLDSKLIEISSLDYDPNSNTFFTNDDESGHFFELEPDEFKIIANQKFAKKGDYEALVKLGNQIIVSKSNGTLYIYDTVSKETTKRKTSLSPVNDVEGLCYSKEKNSLLLACKGQPLNQKKGAKDMKVIYTYDLDQMLLIEEPYLKVGDDDLVALVEGKEQSHSKSKKKKLKQKAKDFSPSGIAIHPISFDHYIISARGSTILIIDKNKRLKEMVFLDSKKIPQPEGITFDTEGNLFIATEGHGLSSKIFKFNFIP